MIAYLPSIVLGCWAVFAAFFGDRLLPVWLVLLALALMCMGLTLRGRYGGEQRG